ncbi:MAG: hypothetical protein KF729_01910 [Sandaracinaceae bacterium]|nr:hypothetical protein [Sandaracinaceae bacterium]
MRYRRPLLCLVLAACGPAQTAEPAQTEREPASRPPARDEATSAPPGAPPRPDAAPPDGLYAAALQPQATSDALRVVNGSHDRAYAVVGERLEPPVQPVGAANDENTTYELVAALAAGACSSVVLVIGGLVRAPSSSIGDPTGCEAHFSLDAADADRAATLFGVARVDRVELGRDLRGTLSMSQTSFLPSERVVAQLVIENPEAGAPVQVHVIEDPRLQWNVRLTGTRDDRARVPERTDLPIGLSVFGGTAWRTLDAGRAVTQPIWIGAQLDLSTPGRYLIGVAVDVELAPAGIGPDQDEARFRRWTQTFHGSVSFEVL